MQVWFDSSFLHESKVYLFQVNEVQRVDRIVKEHLTKWAQEAERLVSGKLQKQQYAELEKGYRAKVDESKEKIEQILLTL